jgi:hypothetical protein
MGSFFLHVLPDVVLAEGRIGQHPVKALELAILGLVLGLAQGVLLTDDGVRNAVQQHIHFADGPGGAHLFLAIESQFRGIGPAFPQVVAGLDQHAPGPHRRVINTHALLGIADFDADAHHLDRGVELTGLFAGGIRKELDQPLIGSAEQVGKLKIIIAERDLFKVLDEVDQGVVVQGVLPDLAVEVDVPLSTSCKASDWLLQGLPGLC